MPQRAATADSGDPPSGKTMTGPPSPPPSPSPLRFFAVILLSPLMSQSGSGMRPPQTSSALPPSLFCPALYHSFVRWDVVSVGRNSSSCYDDGGRRRNLFFLKKNLRNISRGVKSRAAGGVLKIHFSKGDFRTPINANEIAVPNEAE